MQVFNPLNGHPAPAPPSYLSSVSGMTSLIPGPFILLLLLPSLPLLLFTIGARPPDTSAMPFSLMEVFTTAAFVSVAGGVLIAMVVWPDIGREIGAWIGTGAGAETRTTHASLSGSTGGWRSLLSGRSAEMGQSTARTVQCQAAGGIGGNVARTRNILPKTQAGRAALRTYYLRKAFIQLYGPTRPYMPTALFFMCLSLAILVVVVGNLLRRIYELDGPFSSSGRSDSSSSGSSRPSSSDPTASSPWIMAEIKKRQAEQAQGKSPDQTLERFKKESDAERKVMKAKLEKIGPDEGKQYQRKKEKQRSDELKELNRQLRKLRLTTVGTEGDEKAGAKEQAAEESRGEAGGGSGDVKEGVAKNKENSGSGLRAAFARWQSFWPRDFKWKPAGSGASTSLSEKLKRAVLPIPLKHALPPGTGQTWEIASDPQAVAASMQSAANAQSLAAKMKA